MYYDGIGELVIVRLFGDETRSTGVRHPLHIPHLEQAAAHTGLTTFVATVTL